MNRKWIVLAILSLFVVFAQSAAAGEVATLASLTSNRGNATYGQYVTLKTVVRPGTLKGEVPTGTVTFVDGSTVLAVVNLDAGGIASLKTNTLSGGEHMIRAEYGGDANYAPSESRSVRQTVKPAPIELELKSSLDPAPFGARGNLTATVIGMPPGGAQPTGSITFFEAGEAFATLPVKGGTALIPLHSFPVGTHEVTAVYGGDASYQGGESGPVIQAVPRAETELLHTHGLPEPVLQGTAEKLQVTLDLIRPGTTEGGEPTGTVAFYEGGLLLATTPIVDRHAALSLSGLSLGRHEIHAAYSGDANFEPSESIVRTVSVSLPPELTGLAPTSGPEAGGTRVAIEGENLSFVDGVYFGGVRAQSFEERSPTLVEAVSPAGSGTVDVSVETNLGTTPTVTADEFTYVPPHAIDAYWNYFPATLGRPMCRGNPGRPESMPGGSLTQTFTVPAEVAELTNAVVEIDPDTSVTAHMTLFVNGIPRAETAAAATGDTHFNWPSVPVSPGDEAAISISFTATFGKIITIYSAHEVGGTLSFTNTCSDGAPSGSSALGLRAIVSGTSR